MHKCTIFATGFINFSAHGSHFRAGLVFWKGVVLFLFPVFECAVWLTHFHQPFETCEESRRFTTYVPNFMPSLWSFKSTVASVFPRSSQSWVSHLIPFKFLNLSKFNLLTRGELWHFSWHCFYFSRVKSTFSWGRCAVRKGVLPVLWLRCMRVFVGLFSSCFSGASI